MLDDGVAEGSAGAGTEVDHAVGNAYFSQNFDEARGDGGRVAEGFRITELPVTMAAAVMPDHGEG